MAEFAMDRHMIAALQKRIAGNNLRTLSLDRAPIDFFSNDYLGIATYGLPAPFATLDSPFASGSSGSRLLAGNFEMIEILESYIAKFHKTEAALIFNSGYDANLGLFASLPGREATIFFDEYCHASILDGIRLSVAEKKLRFLHNDVSDLEEKLKSCSGPVIIAVESIYSMDGDWAPLNELVVLAKKFGAALIVDEAHATGVWGNHGEGLVQHLGLDKDVFARVHTFSKALGNHGAAVVGSQTLRNFLINFARSFIFTTALPPVTIDSIQRAYHYLSSAQFSNRSLHTLINYFQKKASHLNPGNSSIQTIVLGDVAKAKALAREIVQSGKQVNAILHPSVARGAERLRICLHAFNTTQQIDELIDVLKSNLK